MESCRVCLKSGLRLHLLYHKSTASHFSTTLDKVVFLSFNFLLLVLDPKAKKYRHYWEFSWTIYSHL